MSRKKPIIFISHISEEKELAEVLKSYLEDKFLGIAEIFVSSDDESIGLGDDWLDKVRNSLEICKLMIILCSPNSITRQWINFEAGAASVKKIPIIPLCHSGVKPSELPIPLNLYQGGQITSKSDTEKLFKRLAKELDIKCPDFNDQNYFDFVEKFEVKGRKSKFITDLNQINNYLERTLFELKLTILSSTNSIIDAILKINISLKLNELKFNLLNHCFDSSTMMSYLGEKNFEVLYKLIYELSEKIKLILSHKHLLLSKDILEILNEYLFSDKNSFMWYRTFRKAIMAEKNGDNNLIKIYFEFFEEHETPPPPKPSNLGNDCIDFYNYILFQQSWLIKFEDLVKKSLEEYSE